MPSKQTIKHRRGRPRKHSIDGEGFFDDVGHAFKKAFDPNQNGFNKAIVEPIKSKVIEPIKKGFEEKIIDPVKKEAIKDADIIKHGWDEKFVPFAEHEMLPAMKTIGIPLASGAIGLIANEFGGPAGALLAQQLSERLMNEIPGEGSHNKWVNIIGNTLHDVMPSMLTGDSSQMMNAGKQSLMNQSGDILEGFMGSQSPEHYHEAMDIANNPYYDHINQIFNKYQEYPQMSTKTSVISKQPEEIKTKKDISGVLDETSEKYAGDKIVGNYIDTPTTPFMQKTGSLRGLEGMGIRRRGRPKKTKEPKVKKQRGRPKKIIQQVEIIQRLPHQQFTNSHNSSLNQLIKAKQDKEAKEDKELMRKTLTEQRKLMKAIMGGKVVKGSQEAKDKMAKLRSMRKKK